MKALEPLQALLAQTERERDAAQAVHREALQAAEQAHGQLEQLCAYRDEYTARWKQQLRSEATIALLQCYHGFMDRLQSAVKQQEENTALARARLAREQQRLAEHELRVASVRKLIERRVLEIHRGIERREQQEQDAHAARVARERLPAFAGTAPEAVMPQPEALA